MLAYARRHCQWSPGNASKVEDAKRLAIKTNIAECLYDGCLLPFAPWIMVRGCRKLIKIGVSPMLRMPCIFNPSSRAILTGVNVFDFFYSCRNNDDIFSVNF